MIRTQIQLEKKQYEQLKLLALQRSQSIAQLVREGVDQLLAQAQRAERWERLRHAVGSCHDPAGAKHVSVRHDDYLQDAFSND